MLAAALTAHPGGSFGVSTPICEWVLPNGRTTIDEPIPWIPEVGSPPVWGGTPRRSTRGTDKVLIPEALTDPDHPS